jgi:hypothetical protein
MRIVLDSNVLVAAFGLPRNLLRGRLPTHQGCGVRGCLLAGGVSHLVPGAVSASADQTTSPSPRPSSGILRSSMTRS